MIDESAGSGILHSIRGPQDLDALSSAQLDALCGEIRAFLIEHVTRTGGHLGPNLGVVELTVAIHRVFHSPADPIVFDAGHQSYVHKLLTGRQDFTALRQAGGLSGYPSRAESPHDVVENSHASASLSWADGISRGLRARGRTDRTVVAVIGDGALTGGMAWEALDSIAGDQDRPLVIVINDNGRSYSPTVGGLATRLRELRQASRPYPAGLSRGPAAGEDLFGDLGLECIGPVDGHDRAALERALGEAKSRRRAVLVHVVTEKGHGYAPALADERDHFHAVGRIDAATGRPLSGPGSEPGASTWTDEFGRTLLCLARTDERVIGITAAMSLPVGFGPLSREFPGRMIDVGIAEEHAVTAAAGLAFAGFHPVVALYSTFLNRAFDQLLMDVGLHGAGVTFALDRSGVTGSDGPSHNGQWDLAIAGLVPGMRVAAPRDAATLRAELGEAVAEQRHPTLLRYPKGALPAPIPAIERSHGGVDVLARVGSRQRVLIVAVGAMAGEAVRATAELGRRGVGVLTVDPRWVLPVRDELVELAAGFSLVVTVEDGARTQGVGAALRGALADLGAPTRTLVLGLPDAYLPQGSRCEVLIQHGLDVDGIVHAVELELGSV